MKNLNAGLCAIVLAIFGVFLVQATPTGSQNLLGANRCTWGPTYWCRNLTNAKSCNSVRHCIQTVWEKETVPVDTDGICAICKDMVTQARDQLRSNETIDEMRQVFEGSCKLIPIKFAKKECIKLADDFIPELIETLSSQMNPDQVCSVAGLCNNVYYDELLMSSYKEALEGEISEETEEIITPGTVSDVTTKKPLLTCGNCNQVAALIQHKFNTAKRDDILENILRLCGSMSSFSDACASIALTYFNEIYDQLQQSLDAEAVCHLSGSCVAKYHQHPEDAQEEPAIELSLVQGDDIPCELCEQLVKHMRDVLIANTTEAEFKQVLQGLCSQTKGFKTECLSLVDQYYDVIYRSLLSDLDANGACFLIGICPASKNSQQLQSGDIRPLLPVLPPAKIEISIRPKYLLGAHEPKFTQEELKNMQLPIDRLMGPLNAQALVNGGELCTMCEYLIHFIQETLATPATEDEIKTTVNRICEKMNKGLKGHCHDFIDMYGDAFIALLIQGLNPREICPILKMCPENENDTEVFSPITISSEQQEKPTCALCVFAVEQAKAKIQDNKTKKNIQDVLYHLCSHLPTKLQAECVDFVQTYSKELIDMLISDYSSQEICSTIKLCTDNENYLTKMGIFFDTNSDEESGSNEMEVEESPADISFGHDSITRPDCLLCEQIIKMIEKRAGKQPSKSAIVKAMHHSCDKLRPHIQKNCHAFVNEFGDKIADLILMETDPKMICREMGFCSIWSEQDDLEIDEALKYDVVAMPNDRLTGMDDIVSMKSIMVKDPPNCVLCEFLMTKLESELKNKSTQAEIKNAVEHICDIMPKTVSKSCNRFVEQYANTIIMLIDTMPPHEICKSMKLCPSNLDIVVTDAVIECGVCHGASMALLPLFHQHFDKSAIDINDMISVGCENLPAKYFESCSELIAVYGHSMLNLSKQPQANEAFVCTQIGKCFDNEKSGLAFAKISA